MLSIHASIKGRSSKGAATDNTGVDGDQTLELIDDHMLNSGEGDDDDFEDDDDDFDEELMRVLAHGPNSKFKYSWKMLVPVVVILIGLLFTFGFFMGSISSEETRLVPAGGVSHATGSSSGSGFGEAENSVFSQGGRITTKGSSSSMASPALAGEGAAVLRLEEALKHEVDKEEKLASDLAALKRKWAAMSSRVTEMESRGRELIHEESEHLGSEAALSSRISEIERRCFYRFALTTINSTDIRRMAASSGEKQPARPLLDIDLNLFREEVIAFREGLERYWHGPEALEKSLLLRPGDQRYEKGIDFIAEKFARALVYGDRFIIGAMGSSVTAGHDNCNFDSYERQMERLLQPLLKKANIELTVRNAGQGGSCGDSFENQIWCARHLLGDDIDIAHYSWTYFEGDRDVVHAAHESWIRWVLMMQGAPVPQFFNTGGRNDDECAAAIDENGFLLNAYGQYGVNIVCLQNGISQVAGYPGKKWGAIGDGFHTTTRYGAPSNVTDVRRRSLGVVFRNWHPGPLGFQVVSDAFSYHYTYALLRAVEKITQFLNENAGDKSKLSGRWPRGKRVLTIEELPKPRYCPEELCSQEEPPGCSNWEVPTYGRGQIRVLEPRDSMNPFKDEALPTDRGWQHWEAGKRQLIPKEERNREGCEHLDVCAGLQGDVESGLLTFRLPRMTVGRVMVCSPDGKQAGEKLIQDVEFRIEKEIISNPQQARANRTSRTCMSAR
eukprot:jgi/Bigna1/81206/fgenesh1_pg.78_\